MTNKGGGEGGGEGAQLENLSDNLFLYYSLLLQPHPLLLSVDTS